MTDEMSARLLHQIAETALRPEVWPVLLEDLATFAGARGAFLIPLNGDVAGLQVTESLDALLDSYTRDGWAQNDFRYRGKAKMLRDGITVDQDFVDSDTMRREPFYRGFLASHGLRFFAGLAITSGPTAWALTLQRGISADPFSQEEQAQLRRFVGPLQDAVRIGRALGEAYARGSIDQLSAEGVACLLFDESGRITFLNEGAKRLLGHTIDISHGHLRTKSSQLSRELDQRIRIALNPPALGNPIGSTPLLLGHPKAEFTLRVTPFPRYADTIFRTYRGMVQIKRIQRSLNLDIPLVEQAFGLSRKEADTLRALMRRSNLVDAANDIGISYETARSHLKSIFAKTGTRSQTKLIAVMTNYTHIDGSV